MNKDTSQYGFQTKKKIKEHLEMSGISRFLQNFNPLFHLISIGSSFLQVIITSFVIFLTIKNFIIMCNGVGNPFNLDIDLRNYFMELDKIFSSLQWYMIPLIIIIYSVGLINTSSDLLNKSQDIINFIIFLTMFLSGIFFNIDNGLSKTGSGLMSFGSVIYFLTFISRIVAYIINYFTKISDKQNVVKTMNIINLVCLFISLVCFILFVIFKNR